jgi:hypothetical protein
MTKVVSACLVLTLASANFAMGGDPTKAEADVKREAAIAEAASSNRTATFPVPGLSASTRTEAQLQSNKIVEPPPAAVPESETPAASTRRNILWFIVGAVAALAALWSFSRQQSKPPK